MRNSTEPNQAVQNSTVDKKEVNNHHCTTRMPLKISCSS